MKQNIKLTSLFLMMALMLFSCEEYLDIPPEAGITEEQIFGSYESFQGFHGFHGTDISIPEPLPSGR